MIMDLLEKFKNKRIEKIIESVKGESKEDLLKLLCEKDIFHDGPSGSSIHKNNLSGESRFSCRYCDLEVVITHSISKSGINK